MPSRNLGGKRCMNRKKTILGIIALMIVWAFPIAAFLRPDNSVESAELTYTLVWDTDNIQFTEDGWQTTSNLDYSVTVTEGYIVAYETQLTACEHSHGWFDWLDIPRVSAGHGDDGNDSTLSASIVENVTQPDNHAWGTVTLYEPTYCEAFFLVARGASDTANQPDSVDMFGTSIYLQGTYTAPDSEEAIPFTLQTQHANGTVQPFTQNGESVHLALSAEPMEITILRSLNTLFDEIDFANDSAEDAAFQVLRNVLNHTQFEVISGQTHQN